MQSRYNRFVLLVFAVLLSLSLCLCLDAQAQTRKKRTRSKAKPAAPKPVVTNPPIAPPGEEGSDVKIVSTAEDGSTSSDQSDSSSNTKPAAKKTSDQEDSQKTINKLSNQVDKLNDKLSKMQETDRAMIDMERLTRAEQRAESLRSQQLDVETKLADLQARLDQIEFAIKPENIDRSTATYGSTRPEEARDALRRSLQNDRARVQNQIKILETSKARLEQAINSADAEVDLLRRRLEAKEQQEDNTQSEQTDKPSNTRKKPD
jgi:chromosome segregation ATPase